MELSFEGLGAEYERLCDSHRDSGCRQEHDTCLGRWFLSYKAALRDVLQSDLVNCGREELRVLIIGCSRGITAVDFLSLFHKAVSEIGLRVRCKILALDICENMIDVARNGYYPLRKREEGGELSRIIDSVHGGVPWIFVDEARLVVKWDVLKASGHTLEYRAFDADRDLSSLEVAPFDLVEMKNCHNKDHASDVANVARVTHDQSLVMSGSGYTDRQEVIFREQFEAILREVNDPEVLRFMSGLVRVHGADKNFKEQGVGECCAMLLRLGRACVEPRNGTFAEKTAFLQSNPLLQFLGRIAALDGAATWFQSDAIVIFKKTVAPEVREAFYEMYRFAFSVLNPGCSDFCSLEDQAFYVRDTSWFNN